MDGEETIPIGSVNKQTVAADRDRFLVQNDFALDLDSFGDADQW
jgi:hypothetical protein